MKAFGVILRSYFKELLRDLGSALRKTGELLSITLSMAAVGCWHRRMGRPRTVDGVTYRACLDCGAKRAFDLVAWGMYGPYSYRLSGVAGRTPDDVPRYKPAYRSRVAQAQVLEEAA